LYSFKKNYSEHLIALREEPEKKGDRAKDNLGKGEEM